MKNLVLALLVILNIVSFSQYSKLTGEVTDESTKQPLQNVNILIQDLGIFSTSNSNGQFTLEKVSFGIHEITFSHIGYQTIKLSVEISNEFFSLPQIKMKHASVSLGEVTVSSTRYQKIIRDVAIPMEVITEENILKQHGTSIPDIISNEPGLSVVKDGIWSSDISIRGLSRQNVVTLIDGSRIETASSLAAGLSLIDLNDVEKVEIIKGGVSSLYGTGATGGVVNITTKSPIYSEKMRLSGSISSGYNTVNKGSIGNLNLNLNSNSWYLKFSGTMRYAQNTKTPIGELPNSQYRDNNISTAIGFKPVNDHELKFQYQKFYGEDIGMPGGKSFPNTAIAKYKNISRELYDANYEIRNIYKSLTKTDIKFFSQKITRNVELKPNATTTSEPGADHSTLGGSLQTYWTLSSYNHLIAGIDFWQREYSGFRLNTTVSGNTTKVVGDFPVPKSLYRSTGFYAQDEFRLLDNKLNLSFGGRIDQIFVKNDEAKNPFYIITNGTRNNNPPTNKQSSFSEGESNEVSWSTNFSLIYKINNELDATFNFARSFRAPVLEERFQYINLGGDIYLGNPELKSEKGYFFDGGIRLWKSDFSFRANAFINLFNDLVIDEIVVTDSLYRKANIGEARLYGFDFQLEYNFFDELVVYTHGSYVRGEDLTLNSNLPLISPLNGKIGFRYKNLNYGNIDIQASLFAKQDKIASGEKETPGYITLNTYISSTPISFYHISLRLFAGVENILDKDYRNHLSTNRGQILIEPGRNVFVKLNLTF